MKFSLSFRQEKTFSTVLFLTIPLLLFTVFFLYPIGYTLYLSFHEWNGISPTMDPVGFKNYFDIVKSPHFRTALLNNGKWFIFYLLLPPGLGLSLALLINKGVKGGSIFETIFFLPNTMTLIAVACIWRWLYTPGYGLFNEVLKGIGLPGWTQNWLGNPQIATYSVMIAVLWAEVGVFFIVYLAGLSNVPQALIDAAKIDGASSLKSFRYIIWPMLAPSTVIVIAFSAIGAIKIFDLIYTLTRGGPAYFTSVLALFMYEVSFNRFQMGRGAAVGVILFLLAALIICPYLIYSMRKVEDIQQ